MNVRIFWVRAMECMCAQTRPQFILSLERVLGNRVRTHVNSKGKIPSARGSEEGRTPDAASHRVSISSSNHYQLSYLGPWKKLLIKHAIWSSHSTLTPNPPAPTLTVTRQASSRVATTVLMIRWLEWQYRWVIPVSPSLKGMPYHKCSQFLSRKHADCGAGWRTGVDTKAQGRQNRNYRQTEPWSQTKTHTATGGAINFTIHNATAGPTQKQTNQQTKKWQSSSLHIQFITQAERKLLNKINGQVSPETKHSNTSQDRSPAKWRIT